MCKYKPLTKNRYSKGKSDTSWIAQYQTEATVFDFFLSVSQNTTEEKKSTVLHMRKEEYLVETFS